MTTLNNALVARNCFMNFKPSNTRKWRKALSAVRAGTGNARVMFWGESNTAGCGAGTGASGLIGCRTKSYSYQLASRFNAYFAPTHEDSFFGPNGAIEPSFQGDNRLVFGAGWTTDTSSLGGSTMQNTTTTNPVTFTPLNNVDTFTVWYIRNSGKDTIAVTVDGGAPTTGPSSVNTAGSLSAQSFTVTAASPGSHALALARTGVGAGFTLIGIEAWDSTRSMVSFINCGSAGAQVSSLAAVGNPYTSRTMAGTVAPDLTVLIEGQNDATAGTSEVSYKANMQLCINTMLVSGDVVLGVIGPMATTAASLAAQQAIVQWNYDLAFTNDLPIIDMTRRLIDYTTANADGFMFSAIHENSNGYAEYADVLYRALISV